MTRSEILDSPFSKPSLKPEVRRRLDDIASQTLAHIAVVNSPLALSNRTPPDGISSSAGWSGLETERVCELVVTGTEDAVDLARVRLLVMLDELVRNFYPRPKLCISPDFRAVFTPKYARLITNYMQLLRVEREICCKRFKRRLLPTSTTLLRYKILWARTPAIIFLPAVEIAMLFGLRANSLGCKGHAICSSKFLSPKYVFTKLPNTLHLIIVHTQSKSVISRDTAILPRKLDWMVTDRAEDLKSIMSDNATFIQFPPLGSSTSLITVYGDHRVNIQRTVRSIMQLVRLEMCQFLNGHH